MTRRKRYLPTLLLGLVMVAATCAAITPAGAQTTTTTSSTTKIPAGTVIKVGDQLDYLKTVLKLSGEDQDFPYKVEYSAFVGGPPMLQAFQAGSIDTGFVGSTPLIFAQAGPAGDHRGRGVGDGERCVPARHRTRRGRHQGVEGPEGQEGDLPAGHRR